MNNCMYAISLLLLISVCALSIEVKSQSATPPAVTSTTAPQPATALQTPAGLDPALVGFFSGRWNCAGEFSDGRKIEAEMTFTRDLEGQWLQYRHTDKAPNKFKAIAMWGVDRNSGKFVSMMQDNFGGVRLFITDGWLNRTIRFESAPLLSTLRRQERFTYTAESDSQFKMSYEFNKDGKS